MSLTSHRVDRAAGEVVRRLRVAKGLSQTALAAAVGVSYQQIQKYEGGVNRMSVSKLFDIAEVLGRSTREVLVLISREIDTEVKTKEKRHA